MRDDVSNVLLIEMNLSQYIGADFKLLAQKPYCNDHKCRYQREGGVEDELGALDLLVAHGDIAAISAMGACAAAAFQNCAAFGAFDGLLCHIFLTFVRSFGEFQGDSPTSSAVP